MTITLDSNLIVSHTRNINYLYIAKFRLNILKDIKIKEIYIFFKF